MLVRHTLGIGLSGNKDVSEHPADNGNVELILAPGITHS